MIFVDNEHNTKPYINLAIEEHLMRNLATDEDILLFYINEPSIIIGKHQNTLEEINLEYVQSHNIHVTRRLSGGGAVYHDLGNLNFSFITENRPENVHNFRKFTEPVVRALQTLGVPAEVGGRNDILADGRKISGNAQYISGKRMVSHGTLLFNTDMSELSRALNVKPGKIQSKGIKSVQSRVANISEFLAAPMDTETFRTHLLHEILERSESIPQYHLTPADWEAINALSLSRYQTWDWNYGRSPEFNVQKTNRFPGGEVDARIDVHDGIIKCIRFYGDFFSQKEPSELEARLVGVRYEAAALTAALAGVEVSEFFHSVDNEAFVNFLYYA
ncbi:MAG TPA: lipoate--protein ligase [Anaerolineaceae bacterium]|nr:lipoate--protein ligase [Anaerolineaceae bacterium]HPN53017.1 lipoate--protein ligase [Anaerolineaceae bacterium]